MKRLSLLLLCLCAWPSGLAAQDASATAAIREQLEPIMKQLAASAERTTMGGRMGYAGDSLPDVLNLCRAVRMLAALPALDRYELLKEWMLPTEPDALSRYAMCFAPVEAPGEVFFSGAQPDGATEPSSRLTGELRPGADGVFYFSEMIVDAARECGKLEDLAHAAESIAKSPHMVDTLSILTAMALGRENDLASQTVELVAGLRERARSAGRIQLEAWPSFAVARAWMRDEAFRRQGEDLAELLAVHVSGAQQRSFVSHLHRDIALSCVRRNGGTLLPGADPGLSLWTPAGYYFTSGNQAGTAPGWWVEHDGTVVHLTGPEVSLLYFRCPLAGEFELSIDAYCSVDAEAALQYGRLVFEPAGKPDKARLLTIGERESAEPANPHAIRDGFNQLVVRVTPEQVAYLCNGHAVHEDTAPSSATPWLALAARSTRRTAWRNVRLTGNPRVLSEVRLIDGDRLDGWMSALYREHVPRQLQPAAAGNQDYVWYASDGVLHGTAMKSPNRNMAIQSWLAYHRPLMEGDTLSYEFRYEPDETMVHPALGRTALLCEPDGVRLHWITDVPHMSLGGLSADNAVIVGAAQRGPRQLPLKAGQWNSMSVHIVSNTATLVLNGTEIYQHQLADADQRLFGFFRYKNRTAAQVRNTVLKGNWPSQLSADQLVHPTERRGDDESAVNQRSRAALVDQPFVRSTVD